MWSLFISCFCKAELALVLGNLYWPVLIRIAALPPKAFMEKQKTQHEIGPT